MERLTNKGAACNWARVNHIPYYQAREELDHFKTFFRYLLDNLIPWRVQGMFDLTFTIVKERNLYNVATGEYEHYAPTPRPRVRFSPLIKDAVAACPLEEIDEE